MENFGETIISIVESAIATREDRVLDALFQFQKDVIEELSIIRELVKSHYSNKTENVNGKHTFMFGSDVVDGENLKPVHEETVQSQPFETSPKKNDNTVNEEQSSKNTLDINEQNQVLSFLTSNRLNADFNNDLARQEDKCSSEPVGSDKFFSGHLFVKAVDINLSRVKFKNDSADDLEKMKSVDVGLSCKLKNDSADQSKTSNVLDTNKQIWSLLHCKKTDVNNGNEVTIVQTNLTNHPTKKFQCHICKRFFTRKRNLADHMFIHSNEKRFKCPICGKLYGRKGSFREHLKVHNAEKRHQCEECGKTFSKKTCLKRHMMIHTGERPHRCLVCDKAFARKSNLKKHAALHYKAQSINAEPSSLRMKQITSCSENSNSSRPTMVEFNTLYNKKI